MKYACWSDDIPGGAHIELPAATTEKAALMFAFLNDDENWAANESVMVSVRAIGEGDRAVLVRHEVIKDVHFRIAGRK